jgi:hypothetical protein
MTKNVDAIRRLFAALNSRVGRDAEDRRDRRKGRPRARRLAFAKGAEQVEKPKLPQFGIPVL